MGAELAKSSQKHDAKLQKANKELDSLNNELKLDLAQAALDVVGIADPTPISDGLNGIISLVRGDFVGAGLSLVSIVPYAGDALAKTAKGARLAAKITKLEQKIAQKIQKINHIKSRAAREAAQSVQNIRASNAQAEIAIKRANCPNCKINKNPFGTNLPADGAWSGTKGDSAWTPDPASNRAKKINKVTNGKPVPFKDGYPDFSEYAEKSVDIKMTGIDYHDFKNANAAAGLDETPEGMVWHHHQNGTTMELLPKDLHNNTPHVGGRSIVKDQGY